MWTYQGEFGREIRRGSHRLQTLLEVDCPAAWVEPASSRAVLCGAARSCRGPEPGLAPGQRLSPGRLPLCCAAPRCRRPRALVVRAWAPVPASPGPLRAALLCCSVIPDAEPALTLTLVLFFGVMSSFICSSFSRLPPLGTSTP